MTAPTLPPVEDEAVASPRAGANVGGIAGAARSWATSAATRLRGLSGGTRSVWLIGPAAAVWAAGIGFVVAAIPMLVVWMATPQSGLTWVESLRVAGLLWAVAHGTPIVVAGVTYSLLPWGLALVPLLLMVYAGGWAARSTRSTTAAELGPLVATASVAYAVIVAVSAQLTSRSDAHISVLDAAVHSLLLGALAFGFGAFRASGLSLDGVVPSWMSISLRAGTIGSLVLLGIGAMAAAVALTVRVDDAVTLTQSLHPGFWGGLALLLLGIAYAPVLIVWASAYVVGAGVMIGPAVAVSPFVPVTAPTQLPPFPLLAALPQSASPIAWALPVAGIVAGVIAGVVIARRGREETRLFRLVMAVAAGAVSALVMFVLGYLATGSLGDLRLASLGPSPTTVAVLVFVLVTLGAVPSAVVPSAPAQPRLTVADHTSEPTALASEDEGATNV